MGEMGERGERKQKVLMHMHGSIPIINCNISLGFELKLCSSKVAIVFNGCSILRIDATDSEIDGGIILISNY